MLSPDSSAVPTNFARGRLKSGKRRRWPARQRWLPERVGTALAGPDRRRKQHPFPAGGAHPLRTRRALAYTSSLASERRKELTLKRLLKAFLLVVLILIVLAVAAGWRLVYGPLPRLDGRITIPELKQQVVVDREAHGVPWIRAASAKDMVVAQGYVTAQDRLWQMDLLRRAAAGELSEIFGPARLPLDRENRTLGLRRAAERAAAAADPEMRAMLDAYASGVNRCIAEHRRRLPLEFEILGYQPRPWTAVDTFLLSEFMYELLTSTWRQELNRAKVTGRVGPERAKDLYVVDSPLDHFVMGSAPTTGALGASSPDLADAPAALESAFDPAAEEWPEALGLLVGFGRDLAALGSNNFVLSGAHTYSGKPLLANDTHLPLSVPTLWYIVHLTAPGWNVAGFSLPGVPLVIIGHNDRIAWGYTNTMADVQDLYIETLNPKNPHEYLFNGRWMPAAVREETIRVKGRTDEKLEVVVTRHGPIVAREGDRVYALRWTALEPGAMGLGFPRIGKAQDWDEFRAVMGTISGPAQNAVYADVDGNIGYIVGARIPIRKHGTGAVPVPGDTDEYDWSGYIPFDDLPQAFNPPGGIIATANARVVGPGYRWYLTDRWEAPYRTARLYDLLEGKTGLRPEDCAAIQDDVVSLPDLFLAGQLLAASRARPPADPAARRLIGRCGSWDGRILTGSVEASFLDLVRETLLRDLLEPYLGKDTGLYQWWRRPVFLENVLRERPPRWLPKPYASYDELLSAAADDAVRQLRRRFGNEERNWQWGRVDPLEMLHPLGTSGILCRIFSVGPAGHNGSRYTVDATRRGAGPAMRFVADLANFDDSQMEIPLGESGQFASPHARDQFPLWLAGRPLSAPFSEAAEEKVLKHQLLLVPASRR
jgi:penicillin amidase